MDTDLWGATLAARVSNAFRLFGLGFLIIGSIVWVYWVLGFAPPRSFWDPGALGLWPFILWVIGFCVVARTTTSRP